MSSKSPCTRRPGDTTTTKCARGGGGGGGGSGSETWWLVPYAHGEQQKKNSIKVLAKTKNGVVWCGVVCPLVPLVFFLLDWVPGMHTFCVFPPLVLVSTMRGRLKCARDGGVVAVFPTARTPTDNN